MHIFQALMNDHTELKDLLEELVNLKKDDPESRSDLINDIRDLLVSHSRAEESTLYNSMRALNSENQEVMHGFKEHMEAEVLLRTLQLGGKLDLGWRKTAQSLKKALEHHIEEEEEKIFAVARKTFTEEEANTLGDLFLKIKPQLVDENLIQTTAEMMGNLVPPRFAQAFRNLVGSNPKSESAA